MTWYAAHIVMFVKYKNAAKQNDYPIWENIVLLQAATEDEAFSKAEEAGQADEGDDEGGMKWEEEPAEWKFGGVRKLTLCEEPNQRPKNLSEITYIEMSVRSEQAVRDLVEGKQTSVQLYGTCREPQEVN